MRFLMAHERALIISLQYRPLPPPASSTTNATHARKMLINSFIEHGRYWPPPPPHLLPPPDAVIAASAMLLHTRHHHAQRLSELPIILLATADIFRATIFKLHAREREIIIIRRHFIIFREIEDAARAVHRSHYHRYIIHTYFSAYDHYTPSRMPFSA